MVHLPLAIKLKPSSEPPTILVNTTSNSCRITEIEGKDDDVGEPPRKVIKFRNYAPKDEDLKTKKLEKIKPSDVSAEIADHLEKAKPDKAVEEVDLTTLAPKKPDWDIKRDIAKKLEKLEKRTQKAIVEIIRERLQESNDDLATAVNAVTER